MIIHHCTAPWMNHSSSFCLIHDADWTDWYFHCLNMLPHAQRHVSKQYDKDSCYFLLLLCYGMIMGLFFTIYLGIIYEDSFFDLEVPVDSKKYNITQHNSRLICNLSHLEGYTNPDYFVFLLRISHCHRALLSTPWFCSSRLEAHLLHDVVDQT